MLRAVASTPLDASGNILVPDNTSVVMSRAAVAATGADAAGAAVLADQVNAVTGSDGAKGVALPAAGTAVGPIWVINTVITAGANLLVYPLSGGNDNINALAEDAAYTLGPGRSEMFIPTSATQWYTAGETTVVEYLISAAGHAKLGGSGAGWAIDADTALPLVTLAASATSEVLLIPVTGLQVGDILTGIGVNGQVESGGNNVTLAMDVRKTTGAVGGHTDASIATDNVGTLATDTLLSSANLGALAMSDTIAATEQVYVTLTGTTGASCDIELYSLSVTVTRRVR